MVHAYGFKVRPVITDCLFFFSHIQPHRGRHSIGSRLDLINVVFCHSKCNEVREGQGRGGDRGSELIIIIYHRISWIRREKEISIGEGE